MRCSNSSTSCVLIAGITGGASCAAGTETFTPGAFTCTLPFGDTFTFAPGALIATAPPGPVFTDAPGAAAATCGAPSGEPCALDAEGAFTCDTVCVGPFLPNETTAKIITTAP